MTGANLLKNILKFYFKIFLKNIPGNQTLKLGLPPGHIPSSLLGF